MQFKSKVALWGSVLVLGVFIWKIQAPDEPSVPPRGLKPNKEASHKGVSQQASGLTPQEYKKLQPFSKNWTAEQYAKFLRARALFDSEYWSDSKLAIYISDSDPDMDLDDPKVIERLLARELKDKAKARYALPKEDAIAYTNKANTDRAFIVAAFASGTDKRGGTLDASFIQEARKRYGDTSDLLYASLMANKDFLKNREDIQKFRELSPKSGVPDLMEAAYWITQGDQKKAFEFFGAASKKESGNFGMQLLNEEVEYRVSSGQNIRDALLSGSRIYDANEEVLFSYLDTKLSFAASDNFNGANADWDSLAAYAAAIAEWRGDSGSMQAQQSALDRQLEMARLIQKGGKWDSYYNEPYEQTEAELIRTYNEVKARGSALNEFIGKASEAELQDYTSLRLQVGEYAAMQAVIEKRNAQSGASQ
jgi:hypothetical protein